MTITTDNQKPIADYVNDAYGFVSADVGRMVWDASRGASPAVMGARASNLADELANKFGKSFETFTLTDGRTRSYNFMNDIPREIVVGVKSGATEQDLATLSCGLDHIYGLIRQSDGGDINFRQLPVNRKDFVRVELGRLVWDSSKNSIPEPALGARASNLALMMTARASEFDVDSGIYTAAGDNLQPYLYMIHEPIDIIVGFKRTKFRIEDDPLFAAVDEVCSMIETHDNGTYKGAKE